PVINITVIIRVGQSNFTITLCPHHLHSQLLSVDDVCMVRNINGVQESLQEQSLKLTTVLVLLMRQGDIVSNVRRIRLINKADGNLKLISARDLCPLTSLGNIALHHSERVDTSSCRLCFLYVIEVYRNI